MLHLCSQLSALCVANCHVTAEYTVYSTIYYTLYTKCYLFLALLMSISIASVSTHPTNGAMVYILVNIPLDTHIKNYVRYLPRIRIAGYRTNMFNFAYHCHSVLQNISISLHSFQRPMGIQYSMFSPKICTL